MNNFLVIGTTTLDLLNRGIDQMPTVRGDEFTVDSLAFCHQPLQMMLGGNGAISAYVLARLGATVNLGSVVGRDAAGELLLGWLTAAGVAVTSVCQHPTAATSTTTVISDQAQNRLAVHHAGASHAYAPPDLSPALLTNATALLIASYTLFLRWRSQGFAELLQRAQAQGVMTALDIGPAIGEPVTLREIAFLLPYVDYFICNGHELSVCTNGDASDDGLAAGMRQVLAAGAGCVVIKRGAAGALLQRQVDAVAHAVPSFQIEAQGTVGAGDAFNAGFLYALGQGQALDAAVRFANGAAALVVASARGALGAPLLAEVQELLRRQPLQREAW